MDFKLLLCAIVIATGASSADSPSRLLSVDQEEELVQFAVVVDSVSQLSAEEKQALVTLKGLVEVYRDQLPTVESYDYWFLLRFLSAKNFNVVEAYDALEQHMAWRQELDINNILEKDWSDMEKRFPYSKVLMQSEQLGDGVALLWPLGEWEIRNFTFISPQGEELDRFLSYGSYKMMEDASRTARVVAITMKTRGADLSSKFHIIVDMNSSIYSGFGRDINPFVGLVEANAQYYKEAIGHVIFINVPNKPPLVCAWSSKGKLTCPEEYSSSGGKFFSSLTRLDEWRENEV